MVHVRVPITFLRTVAIPRYNTTMAIFCKHNLIDDYTASCLCAMGVENYHLLHQLLKNWNYYVPHSESKQCACNPAQHDCTIMYYACFYLCIVLYFSLQSIRLFHAAKFPWKIIIINAIATCHGGKMCLISTPCTWL